MGLTVFLGDIPYDAGAKEHITLSNKASLIFRQFGLVLLKVACDALIYHPRSRSESDSLRRTIEPDDLYVFSRATCDSSQRLDSVTHDEYSELVSYRKNFANS